MTDPQRAARLWLAVAVATLWLLSVGGAAEEAIPEGTLLDVTAILARPPRRRRAAPPRLVSVFRRGGAIVVAALINGDPLPTGRLRPQPWPVIPSHTLAPSAHEAA